MKKNYSAPALLVVEVQMEQSLLQAVSTRAQSLGGNVFNQQSIGGSNQAARVKRDAYNVWDENWAAE